MSRHFLNRKESRDVVARIEAMGFEPTGIETLEVDEQREVKFYYSSKKPVAFQKDMLIPSLFFIAEHRPKSRYIRVDDGAVPHLLNGADLFAQGILDIDPLLAKDDIAYISNAKGVFFAIGILIRSAADILADKRGPAAKTIHRANDEYYRAYAPQR